MKSKLFDMASQFGSKAGEALSSAAAKANTFVQEHKPDEQQMDQAKAWVKKAATDTAVEATRMGKEVMHSDLAKDAAKGAAVGAGIGVYANLTRSWGATIILAGSATNMMAGGEESKAA